MDYYEVEVLEIRRIKVPALARWHALEKATTMYEAGDLKAAPVKVSEVRVVGWAGKTP